jgi:hypothetical protein
MDKIYQGEGRQKTEKQFFTNLEDKIFGTKVKWREKEVNLNKIKDRVVNN